MGCSHNYVYTQGHFYCTKCGHRSYGKYHRNKQMKKIGIGVSGIILVGIVGFLFLDGDFQINEKNINDVIQDIPQNIQETTKTATDIATETSNTVQEKITDQIESIQKSESIIIPQKSQTSESKSVDKPQPIITKKSDDELIQYALEQINQDRKKHNLQPVLLSSNPAAQLHAEDVLTQRNISHWMSNGEKPYMTYSRLGGTGAVSQNVGFSGYDDPQECKKLNVICKKTDPFDSIKSSEYSMMYDDASSNWGHRDNILHPYHTHVSLGIAYDDYTFAFVQNFEDNYLVSKNPIMISGNHVTIDSSLKSGKILNIGIFYDSLPTPELYLQHRDDGYYQFGDNIAVVQPPPPPNSYYTQPSGYKLIEANRWNASGNTVLIDFDMSSILTKSGVYTIGVWVNDDGEDFIVTSYSVYYKQ